MPLSFKSIVQGGIDDWFGMMNFFMYISMSMQRKRILSSFGGLKSLPKEFRDPKFLVHYFLLGII